MTPQDIVRFIETRRFPLNSESALQEMIAAELLKAGIVPQREVVLNPKDRIDFMIGTVGVEVKIKGGRRDIYRQIERYCDSDLIEQLVLVSNVAMGLPPSINDKPVWFAHLGKGWL